MTLLHSQINQIVDSIEAARLAGNPLLPTLRREFPEVLFVRCDASDMDETPYLSRSGYQLHLIDRKDDCIGLTSELESADGVVIALHS